MELIGYKKCSTCKNIEKLLDQEGLDYHYREIDKETPSSGRAQRPPQEVGPGHSKVF